MPAKGPKGKKPAGRGRTRGDRRESGTAVGTPLTIVGIGASAGGLEAFTRFLRELRPDLPLACVLVQHLAQAPESILPQLLAATTNLPVVQVEDRMRVSPGTVYVMPAGVQVTLEKGRLRLTPRDKRDAPFAPIDTFFSSLAREQGPSAIGIILSGTASDGSVGLENIKAAGGTVMAQEPSTASFPGMPEAAIATGTVDYELSPEDLAKELPRLVRLSPAARAGPSSPDRSLNITPAQLEKIFLLLRRASGVDFTFYKTPTIKRRLQRRMAIQKTDSVDRYIRLLQENAEEVIKLYEDILIHVTRFFRERESFESLYELVFPRILDAAGGDAPIRVWIPGCSTGEEAYSVAIALLEFLGERGASQPIQIFATDVSETAVSKAREGFFSEAISADVSPDRLRRFFTKSDGGYRVAKAVRDLCVFARQDLTRDPPFSRLDLIVCRNVLIYLAQPLQRRVMEVFHYALKPTGFLLLGSAETVGPHAELFTLAHKRHRVYSKKLTVPRRPVAFTLASPMSATLRHGRGEPLHAAIPALDDLAAEVILNRYAPPSVVVDSHYQIVHSRGNTSPFLHLPPGGASLSVLKMAREGLVSGLRSALVDAQKKATTSRRENLSVPRTNGTMQVAVEVTPLGSPDGEHHYLVVFQEMPRTARSLPAARGKSGSGKQTPASRRAAEAESETARLQSELDSSRQNLQSIIQDLEAANEELQSANEEILSSNEELQSTNEELDTAKEELQSTNEEINTVNEELHGRNEELSRVNSDLVNLLGTVNIAIVIVDRDLKIRRFTPTAERLFNLIPGDTGRRIGHIKPDVDVPDLEGLITRSIDEVAPMEREVQSHAGNWFNLRIRPYKDGENRIDGAVLTLYDISIVKRLEAELKTAERTARAIVETVRTPLGLLDGGLRVRALNRGLATMLRIPSGRAPGLGFDELLGLAGDDPAPIRRFLESALSGDDGPVQLELNRSGPGSEPAHVSLVAHRLGGAGDQSPLLLLTAAPAAEAVGGNGGRGSPVKRDGPSKTSRLAPEEK